MGDQATELALCHSVIVAHDRKKKRGKKKERSCPPDVVFFHDDSSGLFRIKSLVLASNYRMQGSRRKDF